MSTIAICVFPVPSVVMNAIAMAKRLRNRGHRVWIVSTPDVEKAARDENFDFAPVLSGLFKTGSFVEEIRYFRKLSLFAKLRELHRATRVHRSIMEKVLVPGENELDQAFDRIDPDLALFYSDIPNLAIAPMVALRRRLNCAYLTPLFSSYASKDSPPLPTGLVPRESFGSRFAVRWAWTHYLFKRTVIWRTGITLGLDVDLPLYVKRMAPKQGETGWPVVWDCFLGPKLSIPEFFLAPRELEFPTKPSGRSHWLGWCFDDDRTEEPFESEYIDASRRLVYCALGTQFPAFARKPYRIAFLQAVIDAMAARPHLQLALATGGELDPGDLKENAPGAIIAERLPQLQMLSHASVMITHCGLHSMMECAARGVPMITVPLGFDQFGNASRAVYHGIGVRADLRRTTAESIGRLIDHVLSDEEIRRKTAEIAISARNSDAYEEEMSALESLVRSR